MKNLYGQYLLMKKRLEEAEDNFISAKKELQTALWSKFNSVIEPADIFISEQECNESEIGFCIFDHWKDLLHEHCLACGCVENESFKEF